MRLLHTFVFFFFFFSSRRRHTRCSRDWSSDVCSSDLARRPAAPARLHHPAARQHYEGARGQRGAERRGQRRSAGGPAGHREPPAREIGRASCRERGEVSGGGGPGKKKEEKSGRSGR